MIVPDTCRYFIFVRSDLKFEINSRPELANQGV